MNNEKLQLIWEMLDSASRAIGEDMRRADKAGDKDTHVALTRVYLALDSAMYSIELLPKK